jgi:uncharacterized protein (TIGR00295 family)
MVKRLWKSVTERLPSRDECLKLLKNAGCSDSVIKHCIAVERHALKIAQKTNANLNLVSRGALLHDIGRGKTHGIQHAVIGADIARELGLSEEIACIIEKHIGAGLSPDEAESLGLPRRDYILKILEEKIVAHADNLVGEHEVRPISEVVSRLKDRGYPLVAQKVLALHKELSDICGVDLDRI